MAIFNLEYYKGTDQYSDGDVEEEILSLVKNGRHIEDMMPEEISYPILYHLSKERENVLNWYPFKPDSTVLEIGAGCGAISGMLCKRNKKVVSVDLSKRRATINYERNKEVSNLEIWVGNLNDMQFGELFDYVVLNGVFEYAMSFTEGDKPYQTFLNNIANYLKPDGVVLIAIENRLGLKYFAGAPEDHTDSFLLGLNEYQGNGSVRTFSKTELKAILEDCEFKYSRFYYPYPDYKFPNVIFSDETINSMGYGNDYYDFQGKRMLLFNESAVAKSLAREQVADVFSNSFLVETSREKLNENNRVSYAKINSDRKKQFQILTRIKNADDNKIVIKEALSEEAKQHIKQLKINCNEGSYKNFKCLKVDENTDNAVEYRFLCGRTMQEAFTSLYENGDADAIVRFIDEYYDDILVANSAEMDFGGDCFRETFGDDIHGKELCMNPANIDLILDNIFEIENEKLVIDCEWILQFGVPIRFILWRTLNELYNRIPELENVVPRSFLRERYNISESESERYVRWNSFFTLDYVGANSMERVSKKKQNVSIEEAYRRKVRENKICPSLYIDCGTGFNEETKIYSEHDLDDGKFEITYDLSNYGDIEKLRWDPVDGNLCKCRLEVLCGDEWKCVNASNSAEENEMWDVFWTGDPNYEIAPMMINDDKVTLRGTYYLLSDEETSSVANDVNSKYKQIKNYSRMVELDLVRLNDENVLLKKESKVEQQKIAELQTKLYNIEHSKVWRLANKIREIKQKKK